MKKLLTIVCGAALGLGAAGAANANRVNWSIGINLPAVGAVVSTGPAYYPGRAYYPTPAYVAAPEVVYAAPAPVYYAPRYSGYYGSPVVYARPGYGGRYRGGWDGHRGWGPERRFDQVQYRR